VVDATSERACEKRNGQHQMLHAAEVDWGHDGVEQGHIKTRVGRLENKVMPEARRVFVERKPPFLAAAWLSHLLLDRHTAPSLKEPKPIAVNIDKRGHSLR
jgi:hypothetical protein